MATRDTTVGSRFESVVEVALQQSAKKHGFVPRRQQNVGMRPGGGKHVIDWELVDEADPAVRGLVSCKFQASAGTVEEKLAYEVIKLLHTMGEDPRYRRAWLVLGGQGWSKGMLAFMRDEMPKWVPRMALKIDLVPPQAELLTYDFNLRAQEA